MTDAPGPQMWQHNAVTRTSSLSRAALSFFVLLLSLAAPALSLCAEQAKSTAPSDRADVGLQELERRMAAQRAATRSGNSAAVIESSQKLAALALQQMANLSLVQGARQQSVELYRQSLKLEDSEAARVDLAGRRFRTKKNEL